MSPKPRRRGAALEDALLSAAWDELLEAGYDALTIEGVAERAQTSRAVVYRRWATKHDLVSAAIAHAGAREELETPDTGTLRGDLLAVLSWANRTRVRMGIRVAARLAGYYTETGSNLADLREVYIGGRPSHMDAILQRAIDRGEVNAARLTPRVRTLPMDLFRHELLMTLRPVPERVIEQIVDEIFLPLVTSAGQDQSRR